MEEVESLLQLKHNQTLTSLQSKKRDAKKTQKGKAATQKYEIVNDEEPINIEK